MNTQHPTETLARGRSDQNGERRLQNLRFWASGGFGVQGSGFGVEVSGFRVQSGRWLAAGWNVAMKHRDRPCPQRSGPRPRIVKSRIVKL